jgi:hypothetical protein
MNFTYINNAFAVQRMLNMNCMLSTKRKTSMRKEMIPNSVDGYAEQLCSSAYFGASSIFAVAAVAFIRSFKRTEKQFVSIKNTRERRKKIAQIAHERKGKGIYA